MNQKRIRRLMRLMRLMPIYQKPNTSKPRKGHKTYPYLEAIHRFDAPGIMNTDQGSQFTSFAWTDRLKRAGTRISMDGKGRCLDNIFIERLWRSLKYECVYLHAWETGSQAKAGVGRWITFYNHQRPHAAHGGQPPAVVYFNQIETDQQGQRVA